MDMTRPGNSATIWTVTVYLVAAAPHLLAMPVALLAFTLAGPGWRLLAIRFNWQPPHLLVRLVLTVTGVAMVVITHGAFWGRRTATSLLCVMLAAKMLELFRYRDLRLVASLSFFIIATQFLFSENLYLLAYLALGCWVAIQALFRIQLDADHESEHHPAIRFTSGLRRSALILVLAAPFALALFIFFPRLAQPLWGIPEDALEGRTGLSDTMSPGTIADLYMDESPAFRVEFESEMPPPRERYWRGPVLWQFDGTTWERLFYANTPAATRPAANASSWRYRVQLEPSDRHWLYVLDYPARWSERARLTTDYQLLRRKPVSSVLEYEVISEPDFTDTPELSLLFRREALALPEGRNPRTLEMARALRARYPDDRALIDHVLDWFNTEEFYYRLDTVPLGAHGVDEFLFDVREGYCEYYASAFAVLMRAAGIPARIVTGYQGGFWQPGGGYLLVRQSDAHAWTEVWLADSGWTRVDPTAAVAPSRIRDGADSLNHSRGLFDVPWMRDLRNRYDLLAHWWNERVIGFNAERQRGMLRQLGLPELSIPGLGLIMVFAATAALGLAWLIHALMPGARATGRAQRLWNRVLRRLARSGIQRRPGETPLEFARRTARTRPAIARRILTLAEAYNRLHYGPPGRGDLDAFRRDVSTFRAGHGRVRA